MFQKIFPNSREIFLAINYTFADSSVFVILDDPIHTKTQQQLATTVTMKLFKKGGTYYLQTTDKWGAKTEIISSFEAKEFMKTK